MKKYKHIFLSCLIVLLTLVLVGCSKTYTVTFVDYDGTVLWTEEVQEGGTATAQDPASGGKQRFLPPDRTVWPRGLHRKKSKM